MVHEAESAPVKHRSSFRTPSSVSSAYLCTSTASVSNTECMFRSWKEKESRKKEISIREVAGECLCSRQIPGTSFVGVEMDDLTAIR